MIEIKILGACCANCTKLTQNAEQAVRELGVEATVTKIEDMAEIMSYGVLRTPGLVIDGKLKSYGRVLSTDDIKALIAAGRK